MLKCQKDFFEILISNFSVYFVGKAFSFFVAFVQFRNSGCNKRSQSCVLLARMVQLM